MTNLWRVENGVLTVGDISPARLEPEAFVTRDSKGDEYPFAWDDWQANGLGGWRFGALMGTNMGWSGGGGSAPPGAGVQHGDPRRVPRRPLIVVMAAAGRRWHTIELPNAFAHLLHERRELRARLRDQERIAALVDDVFAWRAVPRPPHMPLAGRKLDAYLAIERALSTSNWHQRRPLTNEQRVDRDTLLALAARHDAHDAEHLVDGWLHTSPWPFSALVQ